MVEKNDVGKTIEILESLCILLKDLHCSQTTIGVAGLYWSMGRIRVLTVNNAYGSVDEVLAQGHASWGYGQGPVCLQHPALGNCFPKAGAHGVI